MEDKGTHYNGLGKIIWYEYKVIFLNGAQKHRIAGILSYDIEDKN